MNTVDFHLNPQAAPAMAVGGRQDSGYRALFPEYMAEALNRRSHFIRRRVVGATTFGRGQIIWRNSEGILAGATEPRTDGAVAVW